MENQVVTVLPWIELAATAHTKDPKGSPVKNVGQLPKAVKDNVGTGTKGRQWMHVYNSVFVKCTQKGGSKKDCEKVAFAQANGVTQNSDDEKPITAAEFGNLSFLLGGN